MGVRGPVPISNPRRDRGNVRNLPAPVLINTEVERPVPRAPKGLRQAGKAEWAATWQAPWITDTDRGSVIELCHLADELADIRRLLAEAGRVQTVPIQNARGQIVGEEVKANPLERQLRVAEKLYLDLRIQLGLTPMSKARLGLLAVSANREKTKLDRLLEARERR